MEYWKVQPGDCGQPGTQVLGSTPVIESYVMKGLGTAASVDPEPISKGILSGVAAIFGGFTAHHAAAVASEQSVLCGVTGSFNYLMNNLEAALLNGRINANDASTILQQATPQLNAALNTIKSGQNAAWGYQIAMTALINFANAVIFPALQAATVAPQVPAAQQPSVASQVIPTPAMGQPVAMPGELMLGSGGYVQTPATPGMNANNMGVGPAYAPAGINLPFTLTPGTIIVIGGVAFVASRF